MDLDQGQIRSDKEREQVPCRAVVKSGIPEWGTWENFPAHPTGAGCPEIVLPNVGIHFPSHGSKIRNPMSYDMSSGMQWMALTCRATFSGWYGRRIIPFGVLMPGKGLGSTGQMWFHWPGRNLCENHARKMRTFFTRRLEPKTRSSYHIKWSNAK